MALVGPLAECPAAAVDNASSGLTIGFQAALPAQRGRHREKIRSKAARRGGTLQLRKPELSQRKRREEFPLLLNVRYPPSPLRPVAKRPTKGA
jgi:hypothetical protein